MGKRTKSVQLGGRTGLQSVQKKAGQIGKDKPRTVLAATKSSERRTRAVSTDDKSARASKSSIVFNDNGPALLDDYRPSESEPFMNNLQKAYFRRKLQVWRDEILRQTRETLEGLTTETSQFPDLADRATSETDRSLELRARDRQRKLVAKIDAALVRIEDGTYGYCEDTGEPISLRRLEARPIATLSLEAQERHERRERIHRDD